MAKEDFINVEALQYIDHLPFKTGMHRLVADRVARMVNRQSFECFPSHEYLAGKCHVGKRRVRQLLADLIQDKILTTKARGNQGRGGRSSNKFEIVGFRQFIEGQKEAALSAWEAGKRLIPTDIECKEAINCRFDQEAKRQSAAGSNRQSAAGSKRKSAAPIRRRSEEEGLNKEATSLRSAASSRKSARPAADEAGAGAVSDQGKGKAAPKPRRTNARQKALDIDTPKAVEPGKVPDADVDAAFALWADAMKGLWRGAMKTTPRKSAMRLIIESYGMEHIQDVAEALRTDTFVRGGEDGTGWKIPIDDLLFNEARRAKLLDGAYAEEYELRSSNSGANDDNELTPEKVVCTVHGFRFLGVHVNNLRQKFNISTVAVMQEIAKLEMMSATSLGGSQERRPDPRRVYLHLERMLREITVPA